jgi:hypothetical protein
MRDVERSDASDRESRAVVEPPGRKRCQASVDYAPSGNTGDEIETFAIWLRGVLADPAIAGSDAPIVGPTLGQYWRALASELVRGGLTRRALAVGHVRTRVRYHLRLDHHPIGPSGLLTEFQVQALDEASWLTAEAMAPAVGRPDRT